MHSGSPCATVWRYRNTDYSCVQFTGVFPKDTPIGLAGPRLGQLEVQSSVIVNFMFPPFMQAASLDEGKGGIQWDNMGLDGFPPYLAMLAIDCVIYLLLAFYLDNVVPGTARLSVFFYIHVYCLH